MRRCSGALVQAVVRPQDRLAVDVLLEQALAQHQAERAARPAPGRVGRLVDDVAQVVEPAGAAGLAGAQPGLARLAALPGPGGEAQDLDLDPAALQRAGQDVGAHGRDRDRPAAHRARIVDQQRDHRVAEVGLLLHLERERGGRVDHDPRQAGGVEDALVEIERPGALLLRHQLALQPVGHAADHALEAQQRLVELGAQPAQLAGAAQLLDRDHLVELGGVDLVGQGLAARRQELRPVGARVLGRFVLAAVLALGLLGGLAGAGLGLGLLLAAAVASRTGTRSAAAPRLRPRRRRSRRRRPAAARCRRRSGRGRPRRAARPAPPTDPDGPAARGRGARTPPGRRPRSPAPAAPAATRWSSHSPQVAICFCCAGVSSKPSRRSRA